MKVLDVGSGDGDVALLLADLVGPRGAVVGLEVNATILETARKRVRAAGWTNVTLLEGDVQSAGLDEDFDALVGRWILIYLPGPSLCSAGCYAVCRREASLPSRRTTSPTRLRPSHRPPCTNRSCDGRHHRRTGAVRISRWARNCTEPTSTPGFRRRSCASTRPSAAERTDLATRTWPTRCAACYRC